MPPKWSGRKQRQEGLSRGKSWGRKYALDGISPRGNNDFERVLGLMNTPLHWEIETSNEFVGWYGGLDEDEVESVNFSVDLLEQLGPVLGRPHVDTIQGSRILNLKELRVRHEGRPLRILFAFDPRRVGYLILGGDKTGDDDWYEKFVPHAEKIFEKHLEEIRSR